MEEAIVFECDNSELLGIIHHAETSKVGVLIVVGGPQYRVGSHRQFVLLARKLAQRQIPVMRFDYRGMGDSSGTLRDFESVSTDVRLAIDEFCHRCPDVEKVVIWGLCDAASAALFYAYTDKRVTGLVLLNPWVRTEEGLNETHIKSYYIKRFFSIKLWKSLFGGRLRVSSVKAFIKDLIKWIVNKAKKIVGRRNLDKDLKNMTLPERMLDGLKKYQGNILLIISGNDLTADEFLRVSASPEWQKELATGLTKKVVIKDANHTFSTDEWRKQVENETLEWVKEQ